MKSLKNTKPFADKRKIKRATGHIVRPPRLEGKQKNAGVNPERKKRGFRKLPKVRKIPIPESSADERRFADRKP